MKGKIEIVIYAIVFCLFGITFVNSTSTTYLYYSLTLWISFGLMIIVSRYVISPKIMNKQFGYALLLLVSTFAILFLISGYFFSQYLAELFKVDSVSLFEPILLKDITPFLLLGAVVGLLNLVNVRKTVVKKSLYYLTAIAFIAIIGFSIKYFFDINYEGGAAIRFVQGDHKTLSAVLSQKQFSDKVVYIDLWYSSCGACIVDFGKLPQFKKAMADQNVEYLYLARETSHPNSFQLWKNAIKKYNLEGWHVYMNKDLEKDVWDLIESNVEHEGEMIMGYPHYLIVDRTKIVSYEAERPGDELVDKLKSIAMKE